METETKGRIVQKMSDGGNVTIRLEKGKIVLGLVDNGGLDCSPPDGAEVLLDKNAALEIAKELDAAAQTVAKYNDVSGGERRIGIRRNGGLI